MKRKPKVYLLIQARTNSSRLYGKCLFKIRNKETILLLHDRVKSKNYKTFILTSDEKSDDYLSKILKKKKVNFFRGDLENVRDRFLKFASKLYMNDIIIRCTADNLFVDKIIITQLLKKFKKSKKKYLTINRKKSLLPYGLGIEIFTVESLKNSKVKFKSDLEHVTPPLLRSKNNIETIKFKNNINLFYKRCTMDTLYDYFKIKFVFENYNNKTTTNWYKLCKDLRKIKKKDIEKLIKNKFSKIILGTAQFGFQYGINNQKKKIKMKDISEILNYAKQNYIKFLDTANSYYNSEKRIGKYLSKNQNNFKIISKIKISEIKKIKNSLNKLKSKKLDSILIHDPHQIKNNNDIKKFTRKIKKYKTLYNNVGVSLNNPKDYYKLRNHKIFRVIQIPYNIFDKRWEKLLKDKNKNIEIHARSIFLQGLLITEDKNCPKKLKKDFNLVKNIIIRLQQKLNRFDAKDLLFTYVNQITKINKIIIGVENLKQVQQIPFYFLRPKFSFSELQFIKKNTPKVSNSFITPSQW
jgi:spore coat polysaccharide biosynthesis protein SpsF (cytidylyltransferase family)/aryl-alcohol dehydrogenase-like predicted oxidoreductase